MKKKDFIKKYYEDTGEWYWVRTKLQATKNHPKDSQDLRKGGVVPFGENQFGLDSGLYLEEYLTHLDPTDEHMFNLPKYGKKFRKNLHKNREKEIFFYPQKVGYHLVGDMMPKVNIFTLFPIYKICNFYTNMYIFLSRSFPNILR